MSKIAFSWRKNGAEEFHGHLSDDSALGYRVGIKESDRTVAVEGHDRGSAAHARSLVVAGDGLDA